MTKQTYEVWTTNEAGETDVLMATIKADDEQTAIAAHLADMGYDTPEEAADVIGYDPRETLKAVAQ